GGQEGGGQAPEGGARSGDGEPGEAGREAGSQGQGEGPDAVTREAERFVADNPELRVSVGTDTGGEPIVMTAREYLERARAEAQQIREDSALYEIAAQCLLGGGRT